MKKDRLEERLKSSLGEYPSPMDLEGAWARLEGARKKKKRRGILLWWFGITGALVGILFLTRQVEPQEPIDTLSIATMPPSGIKTEKEEVLLRVADDKVELTSTSTDETKQPLLPSQKSSSAPIVAKDRVEATEKTVIPQEALALGKAPKQEVKPSRNPRQALQSYLELANSTNHLPLLSVRSWAPEYNAPASRPDPLPLEAGRYQRRRGDNPTWWIGISTSLGMHQRNLSINPNPNAVDEDWLSRRAATEKALESYSFSFDLRRDLGSGWYLQSGLRHQLTYEQFEDQYESTFDKVLEDQVTQIIQRADGTTTEIRDDVTIQVTESVYSSIYNTQNLTEIPLLMGYQQQLGTGVGLDVNAGVLYGLVQRKDGQVHQDATSLGEYEFLGQLPYRSSSVWGAQLQGGVYYSLTDSWQLFGGAQVKAYHNLATSAAGFTESQFLLSGVLGLRIRLGQ